MTTTQPPKAFGKHLHEGTFQSYDEVLANEQNLVPDFIRDTGVTDIGPMEIPSRWYLDRAVHDLEVEHIWKKCWQMVCRLDDIPEVGDTFVYDIVGLSFVVVRVSPDEVKAYWNSCLHRGVALRPCSGRVDKLQCRFHGFTWKLDGSCSFIPHEHEYPQIDKTNFALPEAMVGLWEGFVFINPDSKAESLEDFMGDTVDQFAHWGGYANRQRVIHFGKIFPANWKLVQEAFQDAFHAVTTHPQTAAEFSDDANQFATFGNWSRGIIVEGVPSPFMSQTPTEQEIWLRMNNIWDDDPDEVKAILPTGKSARQALVERHREALRAVVGDLVDQLCDSEIVDIMWYSLFPNFLPFAGFRGGVIYRFLPWGDDHEQCMFDVMILAPVLPGEKPVPPAEFKLVPDGEDFAWLPELGTFGSFLSQDIANMNSITSGLKSNPRKVVNFSQEQELKIRHWYHLYEQQLGLSAADEVAAIKATW